MLKIRELFEPNVFGIRFHREVEVAPMEYATRWRIALSEELLRKDVTTAGIAQRVGYGAASAFSAAFTRHVGKPPGVCSLEAVAER